MRKPRLGFQMLFYLAIQPLEYNRTVIELFRQFVSEAAKPMRGFADTLTDKRGAFNETCLGAGVDRFLTDPPLQTPHFVEAFSETSKDLGPEYIFSGSMVNHPRFNNYLKMFWPLKHWQGRSEEFVRRMLQMCQRLPFLHGYGGFAWGTTTELGEYPSRVSNVLTKRWLCVDFNEPSLAAADALEGIRTPSWLTVVSSEFMAKLPAQPNLPNVTVEKLTSGTLFRAGHEPILGDVNAEDDISTYRDLAHYLRPITIRDGAGWLGGHDWRSWVTRFDRPAGRS